MYGQLVVANIDEFRVFQSTLHHDPTYQALQGSQQEEDDEWTHHFLSKPSLDEEEKEGKQEDHSNQASLETMKPFPEEDKFKIIEGKM